MTTPFQAVEGQLAAIEQQAITAAEAAVDRAVEEHGVTVVAVAAAATAAAMVIQQAAAHAVQAAAGLASAAARGGRRLRAVRPARRAVPRVDVAGRVRDVASAAAVALSRGQDPEARRGEVDRLKSRLRSVAATAISEGASAGTEAAARRLGATGLMWVAERDACLTCLALSGYMVPLGQRFPQGATFGDKPLRWRRFTGRPPRHPNCACRTWPVFGDMTEQAAALRREARRSVARGFSLPSESEAARLRAVGRLLSSRRPGVPRSVAAYGRQAVRAGRFPRGRQIRTSAGRRTK